VLDYLGVGIDPTIRPFSSIAVHETYELALLLAIVTVPRWRGCRA